MDTIELSKKFEEIFVSKEEEEYFLKWKEKRNKENDKRTWLQKNYENILLSILLFGGLLFIFYYYHERSC